MMDAGAGISSLRNDQAVSSPKGEKLADPSKYRVVRCAQMFE
jgi:hypothetical protein